MFYWIAFLVATVGTIGLWPRFVTRGRKNGGGGFMGSLAGFVLLCWLLSIHANQWLVFGLACAIFFAGVWLIPYAETLMVAKWGPQKRHTGELSYSDLNATCVDELHGVMIASFTVFSQYDKLSHFWLVGELSAAFILFRLFDTFKPLGIKKVEDSRPENIAIMADDTLAGVYVCLLITVFNIIVF